MKKIELVRVVITHFKGVSSMEIDFQNVNVISGDNGTCKSTVADAYAWCLWGTNMMNRTDFTIYPLDSNNNPNLGVMPEVSVHLKVDGVVTIFTRRLVSKYSRPTKDQPDSIFKGSVVEYAINGVPHKATSFKNEVEEICSIDNFKLLSNPSYFNALTMQEKRAKLQTIAPIILDETIALPYPDVHKAILDGKTVQGLRREVISMREKTQLLLDKIPSRKDENEKDRVTDVDFDALRQRERSLQAEIDAIDRSMANKSHLSAEKLTQVNNLRSEQAEIETQIHEIKTSIAKELRCKSNATNETIFNLQQQKAEYSRELSSMNKELDFMNKELEIFNRKLNASREEWIRVNAEEFTHHGQDVCPTCNRPFSEHEKMNTLSVEIERFNIIKTNSLDEIEATAKDIKCAMSATNINIVHTKEKCIELEFKIKKLEDNLKQENLTLNNLPTQDQMLGASLEYKTLMLKLDSIHVALAPMNMGTTDDDKTGSRKLELQTQLRSVISNLAKEQRNVEIDKRLEELELQQKELSQVISTAKGVEYQIECFLKDKANAIEESIASLFTIVKFKMFEPNKTNEGEQDICECMVDGVPYNGNLNTASRVNAGIDIINTFSKAYGISVPIWVDNKESVTEALPMSQQSIMLQVIPNTSFKVNYFN